MTVRELIAMMQTFDPDMPVRFEVVADPSAAGLSQDRDGAVVRLSRPEDAR